MPHSDPPRPDTPNLDIPAQDTPPLDTPPLDPRRRRLLFRANHRGTHETDLLIGGYVAARIHSMTEADMDALEEVMELPDVDLADWLTGRLPIPAAQDSALLRAMRSAALPPAARDAGR